MHDEEEMLVSPTLKPMNNPQTVPLARHHFPFPNIVMNNKQLEEMLDEVNRAELDQLILLASADTVSAKSIAALSRLKSINES